MGGGPSKSLGKESLWEENRHTVEQLLQRLSAGEFHEENLDVANRYLGDAGMKLGGRALRLNFQLTSINLSSNQLTAQGVEHLLDGIQELPNLISLNLSNNPIGDEGCERVAAFLACNPPLQELSLYACDVSDAGVESLVNALMHNNNLAVLRLDMNRLTDDSVAMVRDLVTRCENATLGHITFSGNPGPFNEEELAALRSMTRPARDALVALREAAARARKEADDLREKEELELKQAEQERVAAQAAFEADHQKRMEDEMHEQEAMREHEAHNAAERSATKHSRSAWDARAQREKEMNEKAILQAYAWRNKLTHNGSLVREWRDGFTVMQTKPGDAPGTIPSVLPEAPRRLKACWCDPHDVSAPYAKTLHYHCKYEGQHRTGDEVEGMGAYHGCHATGHTCATVGFYAKPLPDTSAAHFFASPHPATTA